MRRLCAFALTVMFFLFFLPAGVLASGEGALEINLKGNEGPIAGAEIRVYLAGMPTQTGYRLTEPFGGGMINQTDVFSPELAAWLSQRAEGGLYGYTDNAGHLRFPDLDEGLYLVAQTASAGGYRPFEPFLIPIPWDGDQWEITAEPKMEQEITVIPDTSDPGKLDVWLLGTGITSLGLAGLVVFRKKMLS